MRKFYNIEMLKSKARKLIEYLNKNSIYYEPSEVSRHIIHIEILANENEKAKINSFLDTFENYINQ